MVVTVQRFSGIMPMDREQLGHYQTMPGLDCTLKKGGDPLFGISGLDYCGSLAGTLVDHSTGFGK